jgi:hypothetical protein
MGTCTSFYEDITIVKNDIHSQNKTTEEHDNNLAHTLTSDITVKSNDNIIIESTNFELKDIKPEAITVVNIIVNEITATENSTLETNKDPIEDDFELIN